MSLYEGLMHEVRKGLQGKNGSIPFPLAKMDDYLDIAKNTNYLLVGDTGSGKTSVAHELMLNILDWYYKYKSNDLKLNLIYLGMERKQYNYSAKWVSRAIFKEQGIYVPVKKILGRLRKRNEKGKLTSE